MIVNIPRELILLCNRPDEHYPPAKVQFYKETLFGDKRMDDGSYIPTTKVVVNCLLCNPFAREMESNEVEEE